MSFGMFRIFLFVYWTIVVAYSSVVLTTMYLYQFKGVRDCALLTSKRVCVLRCPTGSKM